MSRILLITHEASRSGAPRVAELVARSLVERGDQVQVISRRPGPLLTDFERVAPARTELLWRVRRRLWDLPGAPGRAVALAVDTVCALLTILAARPDLVYVNSTSAAVYLRPARWLRRPVVLHVHESGPLAEQFLAKVRRPGTNGSLKRADRAQMARENAPTGHKWLSRATLIACSPSVYDDLVAAGASDVVLLPSVPDDERVLTLAEKEPDSPYRDAELVVGCCGTVEHRKGVDLWLDAARKVLAEVPELPVRFVWVGAGRPPAGLDPDEPIEFVGAVANPYAHVRRWAVATLPSRDDPFPLVVVESMLVGTPMVAFAVGGVPDQLGATGVLVPAEDVDAFARAVVRLLRNADERTSMGALAAERARQEFSGRAFAERVGAIVRTTTAEATR